MIWTYTKVVNGVDVHWIYRDNAPFREMSVGESVKLMLANEIKDNAQRYAHCYGKKTGKKFKTKVVGRIDNFVHLLVQRVA